MTTPKLELIQKRGLFHPLTATYKMINHMTSQNHPQSEVISSTEGPVLVIAGPGSGKTYCLVERTANILKMGVDPSRILISTFTEKAAKELMMRTSNLLKGNTTNFNQLDLSLGTLHSIFLKLLDEFRAHTSIQKNYTVLDQFDQQYFLFQHLSDFLEIDGIEASINAANKQSSWRFAGTLAKWINRVSEEGIGSDELIAAKPRELHALGQAYREYRRLLNENNYLDFSTIQVEMLRLLENQKICVEIQGRFDYLMIDEYQDTNSIQEKIILKLAEFHQNLCVVGDDDQSLYRFRGASVRNILEFSKRFKVGQCKQIFLTRNYRSEPPIIDFYNKWMESTGWVEGDKNFRYPKRIEPAQSRQTIHPSVFKVSGENDKENWAPEVTEFLKELKSKRIIKNWNQVAFLFKSVKNKNVVRFANALEAAGIPIYAPRSNMFFNRDEIRLLIGALLFLFPQYGSIRQTRKGITFKVWSYYDDCLNDFLKHLKSGADQQINHWISSKAADHIDLSENTNYPFSGLFYDLLQFPTFSRFLTEDVAHGDVMDARPARNIAMFSRLLNKYEYLYNVIILRPGRIERDLINLFNFFFRFLWEGGIEEYEDESEYAPSGCVSFMTIHQSKGLEFPIVIVDSLYDVPRQQYAVLDEMLEELTGQQPFEPVDRIKTFDFWRLFYTAFSRAQNMLVLTCQENVPSGRGNPRVPSKHFKSLYESLLPWRALTFNPDEIELAEVRKVNIMRSYSFTSDVLVYEGCAQQYRLFKDLDFAPVRTNAILFGTLVHQTIEDIHKAILRGDEAMVTKKQIDLWFKLNYTNLTKKERVYLSEPVLKAAQRQIQSYVNRERLNWHRLRDAEIELSLLKEGYILTGVVDLVQADDGSYEIIDFKSEKKPDPIDGTEQLSRYRRQLQIYAHLLKEKRGVEVSRMSLYYTGEETGDPKITYNPETTDFEKTIAKVDAIIHSIVEKNYSLSELPKKLCENCDFQSFCNMTFQKT